MLRLGIARRAAGRLLAASVALAGSVWAYEFPVLSTAEQ